MANEYWLSEQRWRVIELLIPTRHRGVGLSCNREVISGILHVLKFGCRWRDCPAVYGPHTTIYNRFWSKAGNWQAMVQQLITSEAADLQYIDSTTDKTRRCSAGVKREAEAHAIGRSRVGRTAKIHAVADCSRRLIGFDLTLGHRGNICAANTVLATLPSAGHHLGDTAYDGDLLGAFLAKRGTRAVIKPNPARRQNTPAFDKASYRLRNLIERAFSQLKDWRRVATRYDKLAMNFVATVALGAVIIWWALIESRG